MRSKLVLLSFLILSLTAFQPAMARKHPFPNGQGVTVTSVDATNNKVVLTLEDNKQTLTYNLPLGSVITLDGSPASLAQIRPGMKVVNYTEGDEQDLSELDVTSKGGK